MITLQMIAKECANTDKFRKGMSAKAFQKANPEGALRIANLIKVNMPAIVAEMSSALIRGAK